MIVSKKSVAAALLLLCLALLPPWSSAADAHSDVLTEMFAWWNAAYKHPDGFTEKAFAQYFTPDAVLRENGAVRCQGLAQWATHFRDIQTQTESVEIQLPFVDEFESRTGDRIFTHHLIKAREHGKQSWERVMGYALVRDGKIALLNFVSVAESAPGGGAGKP